MLNTTGKINMDKVKLITNKNLIIGVLGVVIFVLVGDLVLLSHQLDLLQSEVSSFNQGLSEVRGESREMEGRLDVGRINVGLVCVVIVITGIIYFTGFGAEDVLKLFSSASEHQTKLANHVISGQGEISKTVVDLMADGTKCTNNEGGIRSNFETNPIAKQSWKRA